ncbi:hypothetical protein V8E53_012251 [Lactarius tabidus]
MSPNTRPSNKDKHPGIVDLSPQRHTHAQKKADDEKSEEDKLAREADRQAGIQHLANPKPRMVTANAVATSAAASAEAPKKAPSKNPAVKKSISKAKRKVQTDNMDAEGEECPTTPVRSSSDGLGYRISDLEASEGAYRHAVEHLTNLSKRFPSPDIIEVFSTHGGSPVSNRFSNKATENYTAYNEVDVAGNDDAEMHMLPPSHNHDDDLNYGSHSSEDFHPVQMESDSMNGISIKSQPDGVPVKTEECSNVHLASRVGKSEPGRKATNRDLPEGAKPKFCCKVIPTMWHWAAGNVADPFNIDKGEMVKALQIIWKYVYSTTYVHFDIPPIVSVTNQRFAEWCNGFMSAATSALTSLFASDIDFLEHDNRVVFASEMIHQYCFLYSDALSQDSNEWTELGSEVHGYNGAMALAAAALERTLSLVANGEIDIKLVIEDREALGTKRKHKASKTSVWKVEQPNGTPQPFLDTLWGGATHDFMTSLRRVPHGAMVMIIEEAELVATSHKAKATAADSEQQSDHTALAFH